jgi:hypothetical protein
VGRQATVAGLSLTCFIFRFLKRPLTVLCAGSQFARDFISSQRADVKHFGEEWQSTEPEAEYLGHLLNVEMGDPGGLSGRYALWYDRTVRRKQISLDRATTLKEFRQGKRRYRETFAGGCTKVGLLEVQRQVS